jgi:hypothetical protein
MIVVGGGKGRKIHFIPLKSPFPSITMILRAPTPAAGRGEKHAPAMAEVENVAEIVGKTGLPGVTKLTDRSLSEPATVT